MFGYSRMISPMAEASQFGLYLKFLQSDHMRALNAELSSQNTQKRICTLYSDLFDETPYEVRDQGSESRECLRARVEQVAGTHPYMRSLAF